jgi:hypothetical protein
MDHLNTKMACPPHPQRARRNPSPWGFVLYLIVAAILAALPLIIALAAQ